MEYNQQDIDIILKKLAEHGYDGLSRKEKQSLFHKQMHEANSSRFDTKPELFLTFIVLLELVVHGMQRIVLASDLPVYLKLGSFSQHSSFSKGFNVAIGLFAILFFGLLFTLAIKDYLSGKVYFVHHGRSRKSILKYLGKVSFFILMILWLTAKIVGCWPAFINKLS